MLYDYHSFKWQNNYSWLKSDFVFSFKCLYIYCFEARTDWNNDINKRSFSKEYTKLFLVFLQFTFNEMQFLVCSILCCGLTSCDHTLLLSCRSRPFRWSQWTTMQSAAAIATRATSSGWNMAEAKGCQTWAPSVCRVENYGGPLATAVLKFAFLTTRWRHSSSHFISQLLLRY